jgi:capsular polysaccharide biosynthesis protein
MRYIEAVTPTSYSVEGVKRTLRSVYISVPDEPIGRGLFRIRHYNYCVFLHDVLGDALLMRERLKDVPDKWIVDSRADQVWEALELVGSTGRIEHKMAPVDVRCDDGWLVQVAFVVNSTRRWGPVHPYYAELLNREVRNTTEPRKCLLVQRETRNRRILNIEEVEKTLTAAGYNVEVVTWEGMPLIEQWRLARSAELYCGTTGAGLANAVFMSPGTKLIKFQSQFNNRRFAIMAAVRGLDHCVVTDNEEHDAPSTAPRIGCDFDVTVNIEGLKRELENR